LHRQTPIQNLLDKASSKASAAAYKRAHFLPSKSEDKQQNLDENTREGILKALSIYADQLYTKLGLFIYINL